MIPGNKIKWLLDILKNENIIKIENGQGDAVR